jgi:hypothetical protein
MPDMEMARPSPFIFTNEAKFGTKDRTANEQCGKHHQHAELIPDAAQAKGDGDFGAEENR